MLLVASVIRSQVPTDIGLAFVLNQSVVFGPALLAGNVLAPPQLVNLSVIQPQQIGKVQQLSPAKLVNTSVIYSKALIVAGAPSYDNPGGKGDRTSLITITSTAPATAGTLSNLVDGAFAANNADAMWWTGSQVNRTLTFDFGVPVLITEAKQYASNTTGHGTWKWRGSNDNSSYVDLSAAFTFAGGPAGVVQGNLSANLTSYRYYQLFQTAGSTSSSPWQEEWEFKIAGL